MPKVALTNLDNDLMTVQEVAKYHGKSRNAVYIAISRGRLSPVLNKGNSPLFLRKDVERMTWRGYTKKPKQKTRGKVAHAVPFVLTGIDLCSVAEY
jgi:hypothetical protein